MNPDLLPRIEYLSTQEAAKYLGLGETTVWRLYKRKVLGGFTLSNRINIWLDEAERYRAILERARWKRAALNFCRRTQAAHGNIKLGIFLRSTQGTRRCLRCEMVIESGLLCECCEREQAGTPYYAGRDLRQSACTWNM